MKKAYLFIIYYLLATTCYPQEITSDAKRIKEQQKDIRTKEKSERVQNIYANRKYGFSISLSPYSNVSKGNSINTSNVFDITFSDRITWLDVGQNGSLETNMGIGFEPYQGTRLNLGMDYELLSKKHKANIYVGWQYSLGLAQSTALDEESFIKLGFHNYLMPMVGIMWWPGKEDKTNADQSKLRLYQSPKFWQLFFVKVQVGYSFLLNKLQLDTTGKVALHTYDIIRNKTSNTLNVKFAVGINIPTFGEKRRRYFQFLELRGINHE